MGRWGRGSQVGQRNSLSLMPSTGKVPGTCRSAGDRKITAFSDGDGCSKRDAGSERLPGHSDAPQDSQMLWDSKECKRGLPKCGVLFLRAHKCPEKKGRKAEPKE